MPRMTVNDQINRLNLQRAATNFVMAVKSEDLETAQESFSWFHASAAYMRSRGHKVSTLLDAARGRVIEE